MYNDRDKHLARYLIKLEAGTLLGENLVPIDLVHMAVYLMLQRQLQSVFWFIILHNRFPGAMEASKSPISFNVACVECLLVCGAVTMVLSSLWDKFVDKKCLELEKGLSNG